ncbi:MAG: hypothetical protein MUF06_10915 [Pirellulaceae bacterium]|nr:hypothetical protein [Pirellulaceae bacterium]
MTISVRLILRISTFVVLLLVAVSGRAQDSQTLHSQPLEQYLSRLGLADLRLHALERELAGQRGSERAADNPALARKLADAYAESMLEAADDPPRFAELQERVQKLLAERPEASTPAVQVVLLQAEYQRGEALVIRWLEEPTDTAPLAEARPIFERAGPQLVARHRELSAQSEAALTRLEEAKSEADRTAAEQEATRLAVAAARAAYFAGWSNYYAGVARQDPAAAKAEFTLAQEMFQLVLDLPGADYAALEADELGLESPWRARAVIGLGLAEIGLTRLTEAALCFTWLEHPAVPAAIREQASYWHVQGLLNVGQFAAAADLVDAQVSTLGSNPPASKTTLGAALIRGGIALAADDAATRERLVESGIRLLARLRQFEVLGQLDAKFKLAEIAGPGNFYLTWLRGRQQFLAAEKTKAAADYTAAADVLQKALASPEARAELADAAQARYYWAWCQYRLGNLPEAAAAFGETVTTLQGSIPNLAVQAAWMQCVALQQLAAADKQKVGAAMTAMQRLIADFPASEQARQAEQALAKLRQASQTPEETIASLAKVGPMDSNYVASLYEICQLRYQIWSRAKADASKSAPLAAELVAAVDRYLAASTREASDERTLRAVLIAAEVLLADKNPDAARVERLLRRVEPLAASLAPSHPAAAEYHYRVLQVAQRAGDSPRVAEAAQWIVEHGAGTPYEMPALVIAAREADRQVAAASKSSSTPGSESSREQIAAARGIYARLVRLLGESKADLQGSKNAVVAASKLAQYDADLEDWPAAADRLERLVAALPKEKPLLRRAGLAQFQAGQFAAAVEHWRKILSSESPGSDAWLEAKYYQLASLQKVEPAAAEKVWRQFQVLYPEVKSPAWQPRFAELARQFPARP